jgi:hypothetical protein
MQLAVNTLLHKAITTDTWEQVNMVRLSWGNLPALKECELLVETELTQFPELLITHHHRLPMQPPVYTLRHEGITSQAIEEVWCNRVAVDTIVL